VTLPRPKILRGALVGVDLFNPISSVIVFQYNPDTLERTLQPQGSEGGDDAAPGEILRLKGPPIETIKLEAEIDATDQLEAGAEPATKTGIHPQLAALEMLIYPKSALVIANSVLAAVGTIEVIPPAAPMTILVWGPRRVLPVKVAEFSITEEAHDASLNPIRARVSLSLRVLSYADLPSTNPGHALFLAHQVTKEALATSASAGGLTDILGGKVGLL